MMISLRGSLRESTEFPGTGRYALIRAAYSEIVDFKNVEYNMSLEPVNTGFSSRMNFHIEYYVPKIVS
jgi:hypothetical protein